MNRPIIAGLAALALWLFPSAMATAAEPFEIPAAEFGKSGHKLVPTDAVLTAAEEKAFLASARSHNYPAYVYSGCQERAHAAYLLLPEALKPKIMKVWVAAPGTLAPAIGGTVGVRDPGTGAAGVTWGFHVALAYRTSAGLRVLDLGLSPNKVLTREAWHRLLDIPPLSVALLTRAEPYSFISVMNDAWAKNAESWNGNVFYYNGLYHSDRWIPRGLARDQIGAAAVAGGSCEPIRALVRNPGGMQNFLLGKDPAGKDGVPADPAQLTMCRDSIAEFEAASTRWAALIPLQPQPADNVSPISSPLPRIADLPPGSY
jgi:hypothetical protein